jgi:hypothetical protein
MKYLLDVNALIASIWTDHVDHSLADSWLQGKSIATCPLSELGFLRISTHPKALDAAMADARKLLEDFLSKHQVEFIPDDLRALEAKATKSEHVTDLYLAELAVKNNLKLATLDMGVRHPAVEVIK